MVNLTFISQTDPGSGKISSASARRIIRSHVMKTYMKNKVDLGNLTAKAPIVHQAEPEIASSPSDVGTTASRRTSNSANSKCGTQAKHSPIREKGLTHAASPSRQLNRATDAFVYAGSSIDVKSYGFFSHYASECEYLFTGSPFLTSDPSLTSSDKVHVILCEGIQPLSFARRTLCCSAAIQENCTALLYAVCFTTAVHELASQCQSRDPLKTIAFSGTTIKPYREALRYKSQSLQLLTRLLAQTNVAVTEASILCVVVLLAAAAIYGDQVALAAHSNGLVHLVHLLGGEGNLSDGISDHVQLASLKSCLIQQTPPLFNLRPSLKSRFEVRSDEILHFGEIAFPVSSGFGLACCSVSSILSPAVCRCLRYMALLISQSKRSKATGMTWGALDVEDFIILEHTLLSLPYQTSLGELDQCICLALLLYSNIAIWKTPLWFPWVLSLVKGLRTAVDPLRWLEFSKETSFLMFWMLFLGRHAAQAAQQEEIEWWSGELKRLTSDLRIKEWHEARQILKQFFYDEAVCDQSWQSTWEAVMTPENEDTITRQLKTTHPCNFHH